MVEVGLSVSVRLRPGFWNDSGLAKRALSGFSGSGWDGGGAGGCENGETAATMGAAAELSTLCLASGAILGGDFGASCPGSRFSKLVKNSLVRLRSCDCCFARLSSALTYSSVACSKLGSAQETHRKPLHNVFH